MIVIVIVIVSRGPACPAPRGARPAGAARIIIIIIMFIIMFGFMFGFIMIITIIYYCDCYCYS